MPFPIPEIIAHMLTWILVTLSFQKMIKRFRNWYFKWTAVTAGIYFFATVLTLCVLQNTGTTETSVFVLRIIVGEFGVLCDFLIRLGYCTLFMAFGKQWTSTKRILSIGWCAFNLLHSIFHLIMVTWLFISIAKPEQFPLSTGLLFLAMLLAALINILNVFIALFTYLYSTKGIHHWNIAGILRLNYAELLSALLYFIFTLGLAAPWFYIQSPYNHVPNMLHVSIGLFVFTGFTSKLGKTIQETKGAMGETSMESTKSISVRKTPFQSRITTGQ